MKRKYYDLLATMKDAVRRRAQDIPKFRESCRGFLRVLAVPHNKKADYWLGNLGYFEGGYKDAPSYAVTFPIVPGCNKQIEPHLNDNGYRVGVEQSKMESLRPGWQGGSYEKFCDLYVLVTGADPKDDEACIREAIDVIEKFFSEEKKGFICRYPDDSSSEDEEPG